MINFNYQLNKRDKYIVNEVDVTIHLDY
jgi:hypothetical protein